MGGVVARSVFASPNYKTGTVRTILTVNSPHLTAPLLFHRGVQSFYTMVNSMWRQHCDDNYELQQTAIVSIAGGFRDTQVHASLSNLDGIIPCKNHITAIGTSIPDVWISLDHTACMWCQQMTTVISAALSGLLDPETKQAHVSLSSRLSALRHYFESKVPAALRLDSPVRLPAPSKVTIPPSVPLTIEEKTISQPTLNISQRQTKDFRDMDNISKNEMSRNGAQTQDDLQHAKNIANKDSTEKHFDNKDGEGIKETEQKEGTSKTTSSSISWVAALPVEKKTTIRASGWHRLANFKIKWDLFQHAQLSNLQILTTVPLDDLIVLLCADDGQECLDLTKTAAPIPYSFRNLGWRNWQTLKAHFLVTHLKDYSLAGYRYLVVSSVHKMNNSTNTGHNTAFYQGEYGPELFLVAQLTDPSDIVTINGNWIGEADYTLGTSLITHTSLLDANKYMLYYARVVRHECATHPLFTPIILEYSPALREERYEQQSLSLRFHEQYLSYNYRKTVHEAVSESRYRVPMTSQDGLHVFVFADPVCPHSLVLKPDWIASMDVLLRNFGVLIIGGFPVICVLVFTLQLRHAEEYPMKTRKRVVSVLAFLLTSPWLLFLIALYSLPVRFPDLFESMESPWLRNHSFAMMARPWPAPLVAILLIVTSLVTVTGWAAAAMIVFQITRKGPEWLKLAIRIITAHGTAASSGQNTVSPPAAVTASMPPRTHRRSPSIDTSTASWPGGWCISQPKTALILFLCIAFVALVMHSALAILICFIILIIPITTEYPIGPQTDESLLHFRHALFIFYSPVLIVTMPDLLVWFNNMHFEYRMVDSYERFALLFALHVILARYTSPGVLLQRSAIRIHWFLVLLTMFMALYCVFPVYRAVDALFIAAVFFCCDHVTKIFSTAPQDRFLKAH